MGMIAWLPVTLSSIGTILALVAFAWQVHRARFNQSIDLLFKLEGYFFGPAKKAQRVRAAQDLLSGRSLEAEPILDFFETMALLLRRGALDREIVKHTFFYWIDRYYTACDAVIVERQRRNPLVWKDLSKFVALLRAMQAKELGLAAYRPLSGEEISAFLNEELTEAV